jgi:hypothetical protein
MNKKISKFAFEIFFMCSYKIKIKVQCFPGVGYYLIQLLIFFHFLSG